MTWLIHTITSSLAGAKPLGALQQRVRLLDDALRDRGGPLGGHGDVGASRFAKYVRITSASVRTGMIEASTNARNSFR